VDGLLLTRRQRMRGFGEKTALIAGPSIILALVELAFGLWAVTLFVIAISGLTGLAAGSMVRSRIGAAVFGLALVGGIVLFLFAAGWLISHPIQKGDCTRIVGP
jgi:hypothetical protein